MPTLAHACAALATLPACLLVPSPMASPSPASRFLFLFSNAASQVLCSAVSWDASCRETLHPLLVNQALKGHRNGLVEGEARDRVQYLGHGIGGTHTLKERPAPAEIPGTLFP